MEDIKRRQIEQLQRDIRILEEIISGKMENYTSHPIPVLKEGLSKYQSDLARLQEKRWAKGELKGGYFTSVCECTCMYIPIQDINQRNIESSEAAYLGG